MSLEADYRQLTQSAGLAELQRDTVEVVGEDAPGFLDRLLTITASALPVGGGSRGFLLEAKGRIRCAFFVARLGEARFLFDCEAGAGEALMGALDMYHFAERLEFKVPEETLSAVQGPGSAALLASLPGGRVPIPRDRCGLGGVDLWGDPIEGPRLSVAALELVRVEQGVPCAPNEYNAESSPLEVSGLEGITDAKGCYPGQEVIERTLSLGRPPRALVKLALDAPLAVPAQLTLDGVAAGTLTSCVSHPDGRVLGLALIKRKRLEAPEYRCGDVTARPR